MKSKIRKMLKIYSKTSDNLKNSQNHFLDSFFFISKISRNRVYNFLCFFFSNCSDAEIMLVDYSLKILGRKVFMRIRNKKTFK